MLSSLLLFVLLQGAPVEPLPTAAACEEVQRVELALIPLAAREVCVSPGIMTNFVFDARADVELQDEVRFLEVTRGSSTFSVLPPPDMVAGERLRLTARFGKGASQQSITLTLVAHPGQATHQVEVYRDERPRESYVQEAAQERAKNQRLREELAQSRARLEQMRAQLDQSGGLRELLANETIGDSGVGSLQFSKVFKQSEGDLLYLRGVSYRAKKSVAAKVWLMNLSSEPWKLAEASLLNAQGQELKGLKLWQDKPIPPRGEGWVIVEVEATPEAAHDELTLTMRDEGSRGITLAGVTFP